MSNSSSLGRHRAPQTTSPLTALSTAVASNAGSVGRQAAVIVAASGLVLTAGLPAHGATTAEREVQSSTALTVSRVVAAEVSVPATAKVSFDRVAVEVTPAPEAVVEAPVVEAEPVVVEAAAPVALPQAAPVAAAPVAAPVAAQAAPAPVAAQAAPAPVAVQAASAPVQSSGVAAGLVASAYAQIGVAQDCTAMVEKALRSVGKSVGDLAPGQFYQFGDVVGTPAVGDLVITGGHVAIYVGNGQVISGGLNGMNTGLHSLSDLPGASFVRVR
ncbi:NlpC/P60 family protein [Arthrobacter sp. B1805]|uniref:NlpC/P60 family protein n=1 Tax=Arthrobacter sp. B1805 TaxID=2058892 RepID=UPI000CE50421|nr:NlpC/P60 family protein [Arthrobacter sp. B1805]